VREAIETFIGTITLNERITMKKSTPVKTSKAPLTIATTTPVKKAPEGEDLGGNCHPAAPKDPGRRHDP
jgi:hypothetical protein